MEVLTSVFYAGRDLVKDWRPGLSPRGRVASSSVPGWQPSQAMREGQVPNGPGYERLINWNVLRFCTG